MIKSQDCMLLVKYLANPNVNWTQRDLSKILHISLAEVNAGTKRLNEARLLRKDKLGQIHINILAAQEFLIHAIKFLYPAKLDGYTRGVVTSIGAPLLQDKLASGDDPIPVWPHALGEKKGIALAPIHPSIPKTVIEFPDKHFYNIFTLIDVIRLGRPREQKIAEELLKKELIHVNESIRKTR